MNREDLLKIPKLGFGLMRLPKKNGEIDINRVNTMVDAYMKNGFTYFDTAYVYQGSEVALRKSLVERYPRDSFFVADKMPGWVLNSKEDLQKVFDEQRKRTGLDYFDFYLLHSIEKSNLDKYNKYDCWEWGLKMKEKGLIRNFGFSFHDTPELLDQLLTEHPEVDFVQLQINYIDWDSNTVHSGKCYEVARRHNKPIIIMEPVKGGNLASLRPEIEKKMKAVTPDKSIASWAMRFCATLDGVMVVLSGMSTEEQMNDNINTIKNLVPFSDAEKACLKEVIDDILNTPTVGCTGCRYCVDGCPNQIKIPDIIKTYNSYLTYGDHEQYHSAYKEAAGDGHRAGDCIACGQCESICPQHLEITDILKKASKVFD
ncbi:MAG: aldo/keto reductase [[Clostridium] cellulosi]|nr:MAG: Fe-S oxidoreductase [[Clostridium] cellulosi]